MTTNEEMTRINMFTSPLKTEKTPFTSAFPIDLKIQNSSLNSSPTGKSKRRQIIMMSPILNKKRKKIEDKIEIREDNQVFQLDSDLVYFIFS